MKYLSICIEDDLGRPFHLGYEMTRHAQNRAIQRSINEREMREALINGKCHYKQGLSFYVLKNKLVLVIDENDAQVITVYRGKNLNVHVRKKGRTLLKAA